MGNQQSGSGGPGGGGSGGDKGKEKEKKRYEFIILFVVAKFGLFTDILNVNSD